MVSATPDEIGRALYQILKAGKGVEDVEEQLDIYQRRTETRRITRKNPDGSIEIIEQTITDERAY